MLSCHGMANHGVLTRRLDIAWTAFTHGNLYPFSSGECALANRVIEIARTLPPHVKYELPSAHKVGGCLLDGVAEVCWDTSIKNVLKEVLIFGCTVMADGATINLTPLYNIIASSPNNMMAILDIVDLSLQSAAGEKKTGTLLADLMAPLIERLEGLVDRNSVNHRRLVDFCVQLIEHLMYRCVV